jgi:hypothetical protein
MPGVAGERVLGFQLELPRLLIVGAGFGDGLMENPSKSQNGPDDSRLG